MQHIKHIIIVAILAIFCAPTAWANVGYPDLHTRESHQRDDEKHLACSDSSAPRICRLVIEEMQWARESAQRTARENARETQIILLVIAALLGICVFALYHIYHLLREVKFYVGYDIKEATEKITRSMEYVRNEVYAIQETADKIHDKMP